MKTFSIYFSITFFSCILIAFNIGYISAILPITYAVMSMLTFIIYAIDKSKAKRGVWRIPENSLHILSLCCGWPGAMVAQQILRHKSKKIRFRAVFWLTLVINVVILLWLLSPYGAYILTMINA